MIPFVIDKFGAPFTEMPTKISSNSHWRKFVAIIDATAIDKMDARKHN